MSRLNELKKQYPQLNMSFFDLMTRVDTSKSHKYLPLLCKLFSKRFDHKYQYHKDDVQQAILDIQTNLISKSISTNDLTDSQMYVMYCLSDYFPNETFTILKDFIYYIENGKIQNKDVTSYDKIEEIRSAVSLASIKELDEEMSNQVIREFEDETWVAVRPLTFAASVRYGSSTRWCTTYQKEKQYFERYWRQGVLVYFINKKTGYKFALYKSLTENDLSFWNAEDVRVDFLVLEIDEYLYPIIKKIVQSKFSNKNLSSNEIQEQVHSECIEQYELKEMTVQEIPHLEALYGEEPINEPTEQPTEALRGAVRTYVSMTAIPRFEQNEANEPQRG